MAKSTVQIMSVVDFARTIPTLVPVVGVGGVSKEPALSIAQATAQRIISARFPWKWNRLAAPNIYSVALQQDYCTAPSITNLAWLENCQRQMNLVSNPPGRIFPVEAVRDIPPTSHQDFPTRVCWIPNSMAQTGTWAANTAYQNGANAKNIPNSALTQITDSNGNIQVATTFGTSGAVQPAWNTTISGTTADGSVVWTMADPNGVAFRFDSIPPAGSVTWQLTLAYQQKPPVYTALTNALGIPDDLAWVFREGFVALCMRHAGDPRWPQQEQKFALALQEALGAADREPEGFRFVPDIGLLG